MFWNIFAIQAKLELGHYVLDVTVYIKYCNNTSTSTRLVIY